MRLLVILATVVASACCFTIPQKMKGETKLAYVEFLDDHLQGRFRRSSDRVIEFPEQLVFTVTIDNTSVAILLQFSHINNAKPPMFKMRNGSVVRCNDTESNRNYALYQDVNSGASYLASCDGPAQSDCELHGSFVHRDRKYKMSSHQKSGLHEVTEVIVDYHQFGDDALQPPDHAKNENRKPKSDQKKRSDSSSSREKRQIPDANIVELLAVTDESVWEFFSADTDQPEEAMGTYYSLLVNEIDLHYLSVAMVDPSLNIRVRLAGIVFSETASDAPWSFDNTVTVLDTVYLNANGALNSFTSWRNQQRDSQQSPLEPHDHAMAFTRKDFEFISGDSVSSGLAGQAFVGQVCRSFDTSITEDDWSRVANTAAHELGHSLGANHDETNACPETSRTVMVPGLSTTTNAEYAQAQWTFSSCSVSDFNDHIDGLGFNCMRDNNFDEDAFDEPQYLPGEIYNIQTQCKMHSGSDYRVCSDVQESDCYSGVRCDTQCGAGRYFPFYPMAGTQCGALSENKWCYKGECVTKPIRETTTEEPTTTTDEPTTTTEEPTTTTEEPTTTTEEPTTTTEEPSTTTEEPTTTTEEPTTTTEEPTTTTEEPTTTTEEPTTTTEEPTTTTEEPTTTTEEPTTTTEEPTTTTETPTTTTEEPTTTTETPTTTTEEPTTTTEEPTTTTEEPTTTTIEITTTEQSTTETTSLTSTTTEVIDFCRVQCCVERRRRSKCCRGKRCCKKRWGRREPCCTQCQPKMLM